MRKVTLLLVVAPLMLFAQQSFLFQSAQPKNDANTQLQKFNQFYKYLNGSYVDTVNNEKVIEDAIKQVLSELDPHSAYIPAEDMKLVNESFDGSFSGIGIEFNILNDTLFVVNTIVGGPSEKVGLMPNDRIIEVDGKLVVGIKQNAVPGILRGPKGTAVELAVKRRGESKLLDFRIVRDNIPINTVDASYKIDDRTGYIKVNRFAKNTMKEFNEAFVKLGNIDGLILDLRGNGGGLLDQAVIMSNFFLPDGAVIVSTEGRLVRPERFTANGDGKFLKGNLVVLIDESSASGSEIVAGAMQDWDRGTIIGRRSFGKGLVQRQMPLIDGSSVRITVARYLTPTGRAIQRPYQKGKSDEYYASLRDRFNPNNIDSLYNVDSLMYKTIVKGRTVYGGGGIAPDIHIPIDTSGYSQYWSKLIRRGVINEFVSNYLDSNRPRLESQYKSFDLFASKFNIDQAAIDELISLGAKRDVPFDKEGYDRSESEIKTQLKSLVAQRLWGMTAYYQMINRSRDAAFDKAIEVLGKGNNGKGNSKGKSQGKGSGKTKGND